MRLLPSTVVPVARTCILRGESCKQHLQARKDQVTRGLARALDTDVVHRQGQRSTGNQQALVACLGFLVLRAGRPRYCTCTHAHVIQVSRQACKQASRAASTVKTECNTPPPKYKQQGNNSTKSKVFSSIELQCHDCACCNLITDLAQHVSDLCDAFGVVSLPLSLSATTRLLTRDRCASRWGWHMLCFPIALGSRFQLIH